MLGGVDAVLAATEQNELPRAELEDLEAQLGADAAARSRDQNRSVTEELVQLLGVEAQLRGLAPEEVFNLDFAQVVDADLPEKQFLEARRHLHVGGVLPAQIDDGVQLTAADRRDRDHDLIDGAEALRDARQDGPVAEHLEPVNAHVRQRGIVVDEAEHVSRAGILRRNLVGQRGAEIAGAVQEDLLPDRLRRLPWPQGQPDAARRAVVQETRQRPECRQPHQAEAPVEQDDRAGEAEEADGDRVVRRDEEGAERQGLREQQQLPQAHVPPAAAIHAEVVEQDQLRQHHERGAVDEGVPPLRRKRAFEPEREGGIVGAEQKGAVADVFHPLTGAEFPHESHERRTRDAEERTARGRSGEIDPDGAFVADKRRARPTSGSEARASKCSEGWRDELAG